MAMMDVDGSSLPVDSQSKSVDGWLSLMVGGRLALSVHLSNNRMNPPYPRNGCGHDESNRNIGMGIIIIIA